ncbi:hypothetical protein QTP88_017617 [Uroleucon formosanum]
MNLNSSSSIQSTWNTAKHFRNSIVTHSRPHNDSWFDDFCCKVAPCYVPSSSEALHHSISPASNSLTNHIIFMPIILIEFLWVPGHSGIKENEIADSIAKSTFSFCCPSPTLIPWTDFCPLLKSHIYNL